MGSNCDILKKKNIYNSFYETQIANTVETQIQEYFEESDENLGRMMEYFQFLEAKISCVNYDDSNTING